MAAGYTKALFRFAGKRPLMGQQHPLKDHPVTPRSIFTRKVLPTTKCVTTRQTLSKT